MVKNKKKGCGLFCLLLSVLLSLTGCGGFTEEAVLKINGEEILKSTYMVYLYTTTQSFVMAAGNDVWQMDFDGQTADELVEERTIHTLQSVIAAQEYADANQITLTDAQKEEAKLAAEQFVASVASDDLEKMGVGLQEVQPLMEASYLYAVVCDTIAAECDVEEADIASYYQENKDRLTEDYTQMHIQTILLDDAQKAAEAAERAKAGEDFKALFAEYDVDPAVESGGETGETTLYQNYLQMSFGLTEEPEAGDIIGPVEMEEDRYFILKIVEKMVPDAEEVKKMAEELCQNEIQMAYVTGRIDEMVKGQSVTKIEGTWEGMETFH